MKSFQLFLGLAALSISAAFLMQTFVFTDELYFYAYSEQLSEQKIDNILETRKQWRWIGYAVTPLFIGIKLLLVSSCIFIGFFLSNIKIDFRSIMRVAIMAEFVFILPTLITLVWFTLIDPDPMLSDILNFKPWSLVSIFHSELDPWKKFSLGHVNFFQALYISVLALGISEELTISYSQSLKNVLLSYGSGLILWVTFFVFLIAISG